MLEMIVSKNIIYVLMWGAAVCGIVSKMIVSVTLKRLVKAAGNMNKSTHSFMRLVRAKFEHACMISEKVENVRVFVDKYLYEYRVLGVKLHSLRRLEMAFSIACIFLGIGGAVLTYSLYGMQEIVLRVGAMGVILGIFVYLVHLTTDENFYLEATRNYMVDYLENVCLHRYEKTYQKEVAVPSMPPEQSVMPKMPVMPEVPVMPETPESPVIPESPAMPDPYKVPKKPTTNVTAGSVKADQVKLDSKEKLDKDVLIRQILEEFMA